MTHMRTRIFSILLTCAMILSLLPVTAMAAGEVSTADDLKTALSQGGEVTLGANITGGTFTVDAADQNCILNGTTAAGNASEQDLGQLTITGGSFTSPADIASVANNFKDVAPAITGGTFSSDVREFVGPDSVVTEQDGKFVVEALTAANAVASIGNTYYKTLGNAIAFVGDGDTIQVLKDIPDAVGISVPSGKNFTIDFGGHTYTLTGPGAGSTNTKSTASSF